MTMLEFILKVLATIALLAFGVGLTFLLKRYAPPRGKR